MNYFLYDSDFEDKAKEIYNYGYSFWKMSLGDNSNFDLLLDLDEPKINDLVIVLQKELIPYKDRVGTLKSIDEQTEIEMLNGQLITYKDAKIVKVADKKTLAIFLSRN